MPAPSPIGRPLGADGERTRRRIMDAAMVNIAEAGYAHATMKSIAEQAGLTSAAIYHYFRSKQELVLAVLTAAVDEVIGRLEETTRAEGSLQQRFIAVLDEALAIVKDYPAVTRFEATVYLESVRDPDLARAFADERKAEERLYRRLVDEAVGHGELPAGADRDAVVDMLTSITWGLRYLAATAPAERHRAAVSAVEALLAGSLFTAP
jgi:AcrR family transcriptional regulator